MTTDPFQHKSETWQTGEGKATLVTGAAGVLALLADNANALQLEGGERKLVLAGLFAQVVALTISRGLAKLFRARGG